MKTSTVALTLLAAGCGSLFGKSPHVPSVYQGSTPVTVANAWDHEVCAFSIFDKDSQNENWLGTGGKVQKIAPGARRSFNVKPGTYHVIGGFCDGSQFLGASGTYGDATVNIQGASLIALGPKTVDPVANEETLAFPKIFPPGGAAGGGDEAAPAEGGEQRSEPAAESSSSQAAPKAACKKAGEETDHFSECCSNRATMRGTMHNGGTRVCCTNDTDCVATP